ncbi:hypothetical protein LZC95_09835 [Pendulispora brunnea]|uniref:Uncharacterized protein n=1 Tax=Pendulispora brunnea TaxID=2905690 RepID=A0ABZ2KJJ4_9BACT
MKHSDGATRRNVGSHHMRGRTDDADAFIPDPYGRGQSGHTRAAEPIAESLAEDFLASATSGEEVTQELRDALNADEVGGPFVETQAQEEFAVTVDEMNPVDAIPEPFPTANGHA